MSKTPYRAEEEARFVAIEAESADVQASQILDLQNEVGTNYDLQGQRLGAGTSSALAAIYPARRGYTIPVQNHKGAFADTPGGDPTTLNIYRGGNASALDTGSVIGTIAFASAALSGSVNVAVEKIVASGEVVSVRNDIAGASNAIDVGWTIQAFL